LTRQIHVATPNLKQKENNHELEHELEKLNETNDHASQRLTVECNKSPMPEQNLHEINDSQTLSIDIDLDVAQVTYEHEVKYKDQSCETESHPVFENTWQEHSYSFSYNMASNKN